MKIPLVLALAGLAISFALPTFAQQTNMPDPQIRQQIDALHKKESEAFNNGDATALAALYTEDAVLVPATGPIYGREAIEKYWAGLFKQFQASNQVDTADQDSPYRIGTAGNEVWSHGQWTITLQGQNGSPFELTGYWTEIYRREGDTWKKRLDTWNTTPAPAATPSSTASPSNQ